MQVSHLNETAPSRLFAAGRHPTHGTLLPYIVKICLPRGYRLGDFFACGVSFDYRRSCTQLGVCTAVWFGTLACPPPSDRTDCVLSGKKIAHRLLDYRPRDPFAGRFFSGSRMASETADSMVDVFRAAGLPE